MTTSSTIAAEAPPDLVLTRQRRSAAHSRELAALLARRPDLGGVHPLADLAVEAVCWSA